ncbi:MAG TPA: alpha/beta hydrolase [Acidimicrobiales bacterium]|nr:alpha/beta hydrolase [Acidimicrobiales bacterium]
MFVREAPGRPGAPAVVLLHGWTSTADITWYGVFGLLGEHFRAVAPDLRGHGLGPRHGRKASLDDVVEDVAALIRTLDLAPAAVVGYSLGGAVAQRLAREHDDLVAGVVLCASAARFTAVPITARWTRIFNGICRFASMLPDAVSAVVAEAIMRLLYGWDGFQRWALPLMRRHRWSNVLYLAADLATYDASEWIGEIQAPMAVLLTADDVHVPTDRQAHLAGVCGARVFEMSGGHSACLSDPDHFASVLLEACEHVLGVQASRCGPRPEGTELPTPFRAESA